jgi:choline dehydrogenase-like flavoprotein
MRRAIVVGSGAGGATMAKELQGKFQVTVLEAGGEFQSFGWKLPLLEQMKRSGILFDERVIQPFFPAMRIHKTAPDRGADNGMVLVKGIAVGGTTTLCTGNALRMDQDLRALGIDLDNEFAEIYREIPISAAHEKRWREPTRQLYQISREMGLDPHPTPKMGDIERCTGCGRCVMGCPQGAKWDSRRFLRIATANGAQLVTGCRVERVAYEKGRATGVVARQGIARRFYPADLIVLAAGGLGTPAILQNSGIACEPGLFVDPVLCVAAEWPSQQCRELPMPFVAQIEHMILSPYFDYLSFFFNKRWGYRAGNILSLMIKLADTSSGEIAGRGVKKTLSEQDQERLREGVRICTEMLKRFGIKGKDVFLGAVNAGHPGGMLPLGEREADSLHHARLPENLYIADATLLPRARGNPQILTLIALAKRVSQICAERFG